MPSALDHCFTLYFNDDDHAFAFTGRCVTENFKVNDPNFKYVVYQLERGTVCGRLHWQGFIRFKKGTSFENAQRYFADDITMGKKPSLRGRQGTPDEARNYCTKEATRVMGPYEYGRWNSQGHRSDLDSFARATREAAESGANWRTAARAVAEEFPGTFMRMSRNARDTFDVFSRPEPDADFQPREWQKVIIELVKTQADRRTIHWVYDPVGGVGKSRLGLHLIAEYDALILSGRVTDMAHAYADAKAPVVIFDITRTQADNMKHLYSFAESLKNGCIFSSKYNSRQVTFKPPHVFFFSNSKPETGIWSADRVNILDLEDNPDLDY